ncbi:MAG: glucose/mannose-6-phosphate isomerase [Limisphaerales bacterium]|jgi:glucose/mannose-6-phosphate isomerase
MMQEWIRSFPNHIDEALDVISPLVLAKVKMGSVDRVVAAGMGGSSIGAHIAISICAPSLKLPVQFVKGYNLPNWAGESTLVILSSYSGNTEETLNILAQSLSKGCQIIGLGSGGMLAKAALENQFDFVQIPGGLPPRAALGYSLTAQLSIYSKLNLIDPKIIDELAHAAKFIRTEQDTITVKAKSMLSIIGDRIPVLYAANNWEAVLTRWRQQINENGKSLCWSNVFPELNHNELVGWEFPVPNMAVVLFRSEFDSPRIAARIEISRDILKAKCGALIELEAKGDSRCAQALWLIHLGDWLSYFWAEKAEVDPISIEVIDFLKAQLAKLD